MQTTPDKPQLQCIATSKHRNCSNGSIGSGFNRNLVGSILGRFSINIAHLVPIR